MRMVSLDRNIQMVRRDVFEAAGRLQDAVP